MARANAGRWRTDAVDRLAWASVQGALRAEGWGQKADGVR